MTRGVPKFPIPLKLSVCMDSTYLDNLKEGSRQVVTDLSVQLQPVLIRQLRASAGVVNEFKSIMPLLNLPLLDLEFFHAPAPEDEAKKASFEEEKAKIDPLEATEAIREAWHRLVATQTLAEQALELSLHNLAFTAQILQRDVIATSLIGKKATEAMKKKETKRDCVDQELKATIRETYKAKKELDKVSKSSSSSSSFRSSGKGSSRYSRRSYSAPYKRSSSSYRGNRYNSSYKSDYNKGGYKGGSYNKYQGSSQGGAHQGSGNGKGGR